MDSTHTLLLVDIARQQLDLLSGEAKLLHRYPVSTSKFGQGFEEGSFKTPTGNFEIAQKIGAGEPAWMTFKARVSTGIIARNGGEKDLILSRILWLQGLDADNANTFDRYIYFHGTNQEDQIGFPASHGCIRMKNLDIVELFDLVNVGDPVRIIDAQEYGVSAPPQKK